MAEINFLPVCSNCRELLDYEDIDCKQTFSLVETKSDMLKIPEYHVYPCMCPNCGERFETITIPKGLPFPAQRNSRNFP